MSNHWLKHKKPPGTEQILVSCRFQQLLQNLYLGVFVLGWAYRFWLLGKNSFCSLFSRIMSFSHWLSPLSCPGEQLYLNLKFQLKNTWPLWCDHSGSVWSPTNDPLKSSKDEAQMNSRQEADPPSLRNNPTGINSMDMLVQERTTDISTTPTQLYSEDHFMRAATYLVCPTGKSSKVSWENGILRSKNEQETNTSEGLHSAGCHSNYLTNNSNVFLPFFPFFLLSFSLILSIVS